VGHVHAQVGHAEPAGGAARAVGALLTLAAAEAGLGTAVPSPRGPRPVTDAVVELARAYVARPGDGAPHDVAARVGGLATPAWLLAVAVARPHSATLDAEALALANAAGAPGHALPHCLDYARLAAALFGGRSDAAAVEQVTGQRRRTGPPTALTLCGEPHLDALTTGVWALHQTAPLAEVVPSLAVLAPAGAAVAAAALLGLRDGPGALPDAWLDDLPDAPVWAQLAADLMRVRRQAYLNGNPRPRPRPAAGDATDPFPSPGRIAAATAGTGAHWGWTDRR
jgi:hypothetical protein